MKLVFAFMALFFGQAFACSCEEWGSAREMLSTSDMAYVGTFVGSRAGGVSPDSEQPLRLNNFRVEQAFKPRRIGPKASVRAEIGDGANCGADFTRGKKYLIFAYRHEGKLYTDSCSYSPVTNTRKMRALLKALTIASQGL